MVQSVRLTGRAELFKLIGMGPLTLTHYTMHVGAARWFHARKSLDKALRHFDLAFALRSTVLLMVYRAILSSAQGRHTDARNKFADAVAQLPEAPQRDRKFLEAYCRFYLAAYDVEDGFETIMNWARIANENRMSTSMLSLALLPPYPKTL